MTMLKQIREELKEKGKYEILTWNNVQALQLAYVKDNPVCAKCGNTKNLTYDHIIPRTILVNFNIDYKKTFWEENSQTLCFACNQIKAFNLDLTNSKTKQLLLHLLGVDNCKS